MIDVALFAVAVFLLLNVVIGLLRAIRGPSIHDRLTAFLLLGTTGVALLAVLASATGVPALRDAALALVSLAAVVVIVRMQAEAARK